jgi:lysine 2,3-aminomutase
MVQGAGHFRTPVFKGIEIMESLRGHTSGFAVPTYVIDAPEGGGKIPILPNYLLSLSESQVVVRNYEGFISTYTQPVTYQSHDPVTCVYCQARRGVAGQEGVAGLLARNAQSIAPEGWRGTHARNTPASPQVFDADIWFQDNGQGTSEVQQARVTKDLNVVLR